MALFSGYERAFGTFAIRAKDEKGKATGKAVTVRGAPTEEHYRLHLEGKGPGLGIIMLREDNTVNFAAIDYDNRKMDHAKAEAKILELSLPLVLCRSKSGGGHFYCFTSEPVPATLMRERLSEWTALLGLAANTEQFPKQTTRFSQEDIGSWINLPYYGTDPQERYGIGSGGVPLTLDEFLDKAELSRATLAQLEDPAYAQATDESSLFYEGPPCLQVLYQSGGFSEGTRNDGMVAVITYLKKRYPDSWEQHVDRYNQVMAHRTSSELSSMVKGMQRKNYSYRCGQQPIKDVCQRRQCVGRLYGVGQGDPESQGVALSGLTRYNLPNGDDPLWGVEVNGRRVMLTNAQLYNRDDFNRACLAQANALPLHMPPARWLKFLGNLVSTADTIDLPEDAGPSGQLWERITEFCQQKASAMAKDEVLLGKPWREKGRIYFRSTDLFRYLEARRVGYKSTQQVWHLLNTKGGEREFWKVSGRGVNVWSLPLPDGRVPTLQALPASSEDAL